MKLATISTPVVFYHPLLTNTLPPPLPQNVPPFHEKDEENTKSRLIRFEQWKYLRSRPAFQAATSSMPTEISAVLNGHRPGCLREPDSCNHVLFKRHRDSSNGGRFPQTESGEGQLISFIDYNFENDSIFNGRG